MTNHAGLIERLRNEADLCGNYGAVDIAMLLEEAAAALEVCAMLLEEAAAALEVCDKNACDVEGCKKPGVIFLCEEHGTN